MTPPKLNSDLASVTPQDDPDALASLCWSAVSRIEDLEAALEEIARIDKSADGRSVYIHGRAVGMMAQRALKGGKACEHDWKVWPETDGQEQKCMKCGAYRRTPKPTYCTQCGYALTECGGHDA